MIKNIQIIVDLFREIWQYIHRINFVRIGKTDFFCMDFGSIEIRGWCLRDAKREYFKRITKR